MLQLERSYATQFNQRMEGLSKKVEDKVNQSLKKVVEEKTKSIKREVNSDILKLNRQLKEANKDVDKIKETVIPTVQEKLGDEIDELRRSVRNLHEKMDANHSAATNTRATEENRHKNIIIRNMVYRENENVKRRVNGLIQDSLKLKDISVENAIRKPNKSESKPGIIIATLKSNEEKQSIMKHKRNLRYSSRYSQVYIENDIPANQRAVNSNFRAIIHALGGDRLQLRGSRISLKDEHTEHSNESRYYERHSRDSHTQGSGGYERNRGNDHTSQEYRKPRRQYESRSYGANARYRH